MTAALRVAPYSTDVRYVTRGESSLAYYLETWVACFECSAKNPPNMRYCNSCGHPNDPTRRQLAPNIPSKQKPEVLLPRPELDGDVVIKINCLESTDNQNIEWIREVCRKIQEEYRKKGLVVLQAKHQRDKFRNYLRLLDADYDLKSRQLTDYKLVATVVNDCKSEWYSDNATEHDTIVKVDGQLKSARRYSKDLLLHLRKIEEK